ncbi:unnamed protein product, partial [Ectocarpus fasciculatus]
SLLEDIKCAKAAEGCPEGSTSLLVKKRWFDPRGGCTIATCVHPEAGGGGGGGGARDSQSTAAQAEGSDEDTTGTPEEPASSASSPASGGDIASLAIAEKLAALSQQHPGASLKKALATMRQEQIKASEGRGTSRLEFSAPSAYV